MLPNSSFRVAVRAVAMSGALGTIGHTDAARAATARLQTKLEPAIAMLLLVGFA